MGQQPAGFVPDGFVPDTAPPPAVAAPPAPAEGYWEHPRGERIPQSAITPETVTRLQREKGWQWRPPGWAPGRDPSSRRVDTNLASGLPVLDTLSPEGLLGGVAATRAISGAMAGRVGAAQRVLAGVQATITQAAPVVKYEVTKSLLESMGIPAPIAIPLAMTVSGYQRGGRGTPSVSAPASAPGAPRATAPAAPASPGGPSAPPPAPTARAAPGASPAAASKLTLSAPEMAEYMRLMRVGKSPAEAAELIQAQRDLVTRLGLPTSEEVRQAATQRNASGRWPPE